VNANELKQKGQYEAQAGKPVVETRGRGTVEGAPPFFVLKRRGGARRRFRRESLAKGDEALVGDNEKSKGENRYAIFPLCMRSA
jgi:hypothetical protein